MKKFSVWQALFLSFSSKDLYRDVVSNWKGICLIYLILLMAITNFGRAGTIYLGIATSSAVNSNLNKIFAQMPTMTFKQGAMSTDKPGPSRVCDPEHPEKTILVVDTSGTIKNTQDAKSDLLLTKTDLIIATKNSPTESHITYQQLGLKDFVLTPEAMKDLAFKIMFWALVVIYLFAWIKDVIQFWIIGAIIALFVKGAANINWMPALRLTIIASTPVHIGLLAWSLIVTVIANVSGPVPLNNLIEAGIILALGITYLMFAIKAVKEIPASEVVISPTK